MNLYENLSERFQDLHDDLRQLVGIARTFDYCDLATRVESVIDKSTDRVFRVAICGEFSTGKSTLINALLGEELLPTALEACTAVVTRIRSAANGEKPGVTVRFRKSGTRTVPRDRLREILTFKNASDEDAPVSAEIVVATGTFLDHQIELVDTPGVNDPDARGEQITLGFLPQADAVVFVTHAARAFKESELSFLRDRVGDQDIERLLFVVNACDILEEVEDFDDLRARALEVLHERYRAPRVHLVSARSGVGARTKGEPELWTTSGLEEFSEGLDRLLTQERGEAELLRYRTFREGFRQELVRRLEERLEGLEIDDEIRLRRCSRVRERIVVLEDAERDTLREAAVGFEGVENMVSAVLEEELSSLAEELSGMKRSGKESDQPDLTEDVERIVTRAGSQTLTKIQSTMRSSVATLHEALAAQMNRAVGEVEEAFLHERSALVTVRKPSWESMITVHTDRYVEERKLEPEPEATPSRVTEDQGQMMGAGLCGLIGLALLGPWGLAAGAVFGIGAGGAFANTPTQGRRLLESVKEWFVRQHVDTERTVGDVRHSLTDVVSPALGQLAHRTRDDIQRVYLAKVADFQGRLTQLEEPSRESEEQAIECRRIREALTELGDSQSV